MSAVARCRGAGALTSLDALEFLSALRADLANIVFLDPPFNLRKDYGFEAALETADAVSYEVYMVRIIEEAVRVLKPGGALFLYHLPAWASRLCQPLQQALQFRHWIAVSMKNGFVRGRRLYPAHYALLYFTKGEPANFARPKLTPRRCRHCGGHVKDYGGYREIIENNGVNLSDFWDDLSPVRHRSTKIRTANQLPIELTDRVVQIAGAEGGVLVDPFIGSGTSAVSALKRRMYFVGNDLLAANVELCMRRVNSASFSECGG